MKFWFLVVLGVVSLGGSFATMTVESQEYDMEKVNEVYQRWAKYRDVDVEALRGNYFYPTAFWQRPIEDVLDDLRPELQKCVIPGMSEPRLNPFPCFPACPRDELLKTEQLLEDAICNKIEVFMAKKLLDFDRNEYYKSLKVGREKGDLAFRSDLSCEIKRYEATPLLTFFKPFSTFYPTWTLKKEE